MPVNAILKAIFAELEATGKPAYVSWDSVQEWPVGALNGLMAARMLSTTSTAQTIECKACEQHCYSDIVFHGEAAFIVCEDAEMQSQMGRMQIPVEQLQQWKISVKQIARVVAGFLGFDSKIEYKSSQENIRLGMLKGSKGRRPVTLNSKMLSLEVNGYEMPLRELLYFENDELLIDRARVDDCLNRSSRKEGKQYSPSIDKQEARKLKTQAMYQDWNDEYLALKQNHPNKSDSWYSIQIAKLDIAQGKKSETIRKNMK